MLKNNTYLAALPFADNLASKGKTLVAKPNTPMSELVRLSSSGIVEFKVDDNDSLRNYGQILEAATYSTVDNVSQYGLELDGFINDISKLVTSHISFAKNVIKPVVVQYAENLKQYLETNKLKSPSEKFEVSTVDLSEIFLDNSFLDTLTPYEGKNILTPDANAALNLAPKTSEELLALVSTGRDRTDNLIKSWLAKQKPNFLECVWYNFFSAANVAKNEDYQDFNTLSVLNAFEACDIGLAILLMSRKIYDDVQQTDIPLQAYQNFVVQLRDYAGALVYNNLKKIDLLVKNKILVVEFKPIEYKAKVNGVVYREWLEKGGSPEVIFGLLVSNNNIASQSLIDEKANDLTKTWESYVLFHNTQESNKVFDYYKDYLIISLEMSYKDMTDEEKAIIETNPNFYNIVKKLADSEIENLRTTDMHNVYEVALRIIAKCRYYYTSAFNILSDINEAGKVNPNVDVREAALLAAINYLSDYLANQITYANG